MIFFAGARPRGDAPPPDAHPGTFYSAMSNIDIEIQDGNPGAVGVRAHYAQHCFLAHMDFRIGSGLAGIKDGGNVAQDVHFHGGQYGIWTRKPSPGWQFTIIDATFEGQREAAIREHEAGLTLIRPQFKNVPTAVAIDPHYSDELWIKDARMENVSGPAVIISNEYNAHNEINMENVVCSHVPVFAQYRESAKQVAGPAEMYAVKTFSHGLHYDDLGATGAIEDVYETAALQQLPDPVKSDILPLPPMDTWVNIRSLGARGDGIADDTDAAAPSHRRPPHNLFSVRPVSRHGHDRAKARYSSHRPATQRHPHPPRRRHRRVSRASAVPSHSSKLPRTERTSSPASASTPTASIRAPSPPNGWPAQIP